MTDVERLKARAAEIAEREGAKLLDRTPGSESLHQRAIKSLPNGVASNFQAGDPYPTYLKHGIASCPTGPTLLYDSIPEMEERETRMKATTFFRAIGRPAKRSGAPQPAAVRRHDRGVRELVAEPDRPIAPSFYRRCHVREYYPRLGLGEDDRQEHVPAVDGQRAVARSGDEVGHASDRIHVRPVGEAVRNPRTIVG